MPRGITRGEFQEENTTGRGISIKRRNITKGGVYKNGEYSKSRTRWAWGCILGTQGVMPRERYYGVGWMSKGVGIPKKCNTNRGNPWGEGEGSKGGHGGAEEVPKGMPWGKKDRAGSLKRGNAQV